MIKCIVIGNFRGTCSSVGMVKGYMVRERTETPGLGHKEAISAFYVCDDFCNRKRSYATHYYQ